MWIARDGEQDARAEKVGRVSGDLDPDHWISRMDGRDLSMGRIRRAGF